MTHKQTVPLVWAWCPVVVLILLLIANVYLYGADASYGPNQIALLMAAATAAVVGYLLSVPYQQMIGGIKKSIESALVAMMILLLIGALTGTWMISGIVPAMIYYGLGIVSPEYFLVAAAVVSAVVSVVTGSSWSTVATVGIALLGIGKALGIHEGMVAGAIISGAYFGDKLSPLSDTTNLAAAMAGTDLITHVRYMLWTTIPSMILALVLYLLLGMSLESSAIPSSHDALKDQIANRFNLNPIVFIVPLAVFGMVLLRVDALVALFVGAVAGGIVAIVLQPTIVSQVASLPDRIVIETGENGQEREVGRPAPYFVAAYSAFINSMALETKVIGDDRVRELQQRLDELQPTIDTQHGPAAGFDSDSDAGSRLAEWEQLRAEIAAAELLKGKGMVGMLNTIWLIITAMCFGGLMEACGLLQRLTEPIIQWAKSTTSLIVTTAGSCLFINLTASDQYLSIVVPGRMFRETYRQRRLAPENLSRTLEDSGTVTSVLIPWNTCGAAQRGVLGVDVWIFAPYCFFNLLSPLMTIFVASIGKLRVQDSNAGV